MEITLAAYEWKKLDSKGNVKLQSNCEMERRTTCEALEKCVKQEGSIISNHLVKEKNMIFKLESYFVLSVPGHEGDWTGDHRGVFAASIV